ncbi:hypothetical protein ARMGADRAFT_1169113 [Armillaria gallica]|uniref:F-box domain-containing protein n=1 Tax=Armillaria gallica TaxID=47427 RepID=A0A2H3CTE3_ARMGA|nr:hypothetical protein ARMGADRAFT_1169113 [Armillaria gallica]
MTREPVPERLSVLFSKPPLPGIELEDLVQANAMKPHFPNIPPELVDEIIDYLWDDKDALVACSFVCRLFCIRTRVHLFRSIELKHTPDDESSSQNILPYIKKITIRWSSDNISSLTPFLSSLPNLTALHLDMIDFFNPWSFHHLICQLRGLASIDLRHIQFHGTVLVEPTTMNLDEPFPRINKISMCGTSFHASVVELLIRRRELRAIYVDSLHELCIKYPPGEYLSSICAFVRAASSSLKSLDIRIRRVRSGINTLSSWPAQPDLLPLTMPTLQIEVECRRYGWHAKVMTWLIDSLNGANGPIMMETLTLVVVSPGCHDLAYIKLEDLAKQFSMLDEILTGPDMKVFRRLKVLFKQYVDSPPSGEVSYHINWVHEKLQRVDKRNMLDVDVVEYTS